MLREVVKLLVAGVALSRFTFKCVGAVPDFFASENLDDAASAINDYVYIYIYLYIYHRFWHFPTTKLNR